MPCVSHFQKRIRSRIGLSGLKRMRMATPKPVPAGRRGADAGRQGHGFHSRKAGRSWLLQNHMDFQEEVRTGKGGNSESQKSGGVMRAALLGARREGGAERWPGARHGHTGTLASAEGDVVFLGEAP